MKRKIVGTLVCMLLIVTTVLPVVGTTNVKKTIIVLPTTMQGVKDQSQEISDGCYWLSSGTPEWQEFLNRGNKIMRIELYMRNGAPHEDGFVKLSIERPLGTELTKKELSCKDIAPGNTDIWFSFDVDPDVNLVNGLKYYIVLYYNGPCELCWHGANNNLYPEGKSSQGSDWDFCFRTFVDKSRSRTINILFLNWLQNHLNMFPILRLLFQRLELQ